MREYQLRNPFTEAETVETPLAESRRTLTVSELTRQIQEILEGTFSSVWVEGEVSQPTVSTKGHLYLNLKDAHALIRCVVWRDAREALKFNVEQGMKVICFGRVGLYPPRGDYQLYVDHLEPKGIGALQLAFEQLKEKLQKEGLFNEERKRPLPLFPEHIGVVTSPTGAAIHDILKILQGQVEVTLRPVRVQGEAAGEAVAQAIRQLNAFADLDLLIVGRGGGSLEDLWAFNEEMVARAIATSSIPIISAVGHEKDVTVSDLVADVRAPTPTKAAEMVVAQRTQVFDRLLAVLEDPAFTRPEEWLTELKERLEGYQQDLVEGLREPVLTAAHHVRVFHGDLMACSPQAVILQQAERLHRLNQTATTAITHSLEQTTAQFMGLVGRLQALSPLAVLERGYSITFHSHGKILKEAQTVKVGELIHTRLHRGQLTSRVESTGESEDGDKNKRDL